MRTRALGLLLLGLTLWPTAAAAQDRALIKQISFFTAVTGTLSMLVLLILMLTAISVYLSTFWPRWMPRIADAQKQHPIKCFFLGLINLAFLLIVTAAVGESKPGLAVLPGMALILAALVGQASKGLYVGQRVLAASGYRPTTAWGFVAGIPVVILLGVIPFLGWFVLIPAFTASGLGGAMLGYFVGAPPEEDQAPEPVSD